MEGGMLLKQGISPDLPREEANAPMMSADIRIIGDEKGNPVDIEILRSGSLPLRMLGPGGPAREEAVLAPLDQAGQEVLPVLLGLGMGHALRALLTRHAGPVAVVDKERALAEIVRPGLADLLADPRVFFVEGASGEEGAGRALKELSRWQEARGGAPFLPLPHPFYMRLDRAWYGSLRKHLEASRKFDFWGKARQPRFRDDMPRLLLITSRYFLVGEVAAACGRIGVRQRTLTLESDEISSEDFVKSLLREALEFRPDAVLTLNHLGVDREGVLTELLAKLELPLVSWFVDNPHLVLHLYRGLSSPWMAIFTWDRDNIDSLRKQGFSHVFHLPLGTDPTRFRPDAAPLEGLRSAVSFVGNSMVYKVAKRMEKGRPPAALLRNYRKVAEAFTRSPERSVRDFIRAFSPHLAEAYDGLPDMEARLAYETMLTWEATRQYRAACVRALFDAAPEDPAGKNDVIPLIIGDDGWKINLRHERRPWRWHPPLAYYDELPRLYPFCDINFNTTSMQMKGAVNQRVFDVPAAGAFVLTDWREQMDELFEPGKEIVCYREPGEVPELIRWWLAHPDARRRVAAAGRKRVLACHTWEARLRVMLATLKQVFGSR